MIACQAKAAEAAAAGNEYERQVWSFIQLSFQADARARLLDKLGFDAEGIRAAIEGAGEVAAVPGPTAAAAAGSPSAEPAAVSPPASGASASDFFGGGESPGVAAVKSEADGGAEQEEEEEVKSSAGDGGLSSASDVDGGPASLGASAASAAAPAPMSPAPQDDASVDLVKQALLVGNFPAAVDACFQKGLLADALLLASCGEADLWAKTRMRFFERETQVRSHAC